MKMRKILNTVLLLFLLFLIGCTSEPGPDKKEESSTITEITVLESPDPEKRDELIQFFLSLPTETTLNEIYEELPNTQEGFPGILKVSEKEYALTILNNIRALHDLKPVIYNSEDDIYTKNACLIMTANRIMTHHPGEDLKYYSWDSYVGCGTSSLFISQISSSTEIIYYPGTAQCFMDWMIDYYVPEVGHRRSIINPFLETTSFSRCDENGLSSAAVKIKPFMSYESRDLSDSEIEFVAYPYLEYPSSLVILPYYVYDADFSFSIIADKAEVRNNGEENVDFSEAKITITDPSGNALIVDSVRYKYSSLGLYNVLLWKVADFEKNTKYIVTIDDITVNGTLAKYIYYFNIIENVS